MERERRDAEEREALANLNEDQREEINEAVSEFPFDRARRPDLSRNCAPGKATLSLPKKATNFDVNAKRR